MESSGSFSSSAAPTFVANTSLTLGMAIRDEDKKIGHNSQASSRVASSASNKKAAVEGAFKGKLCPRVFKKAQARAGHQKAQSQLRAHQRKKKVQKGRRPASAWSPVPIWPCSYATALRSACLHAQPFRNWRSHYDPLVHPVLPWQTATVGLVPAQPSSSSTPLAAQYLGTGDGGHTGRHQGVSDVNLEEPADGIDLTLKLWN